MSSVGTGPEHDDVDTLTSLLNLLLLLIHLFDEYVGLAFCSPKYETPESLNLRLLYDTGYIPEVTLAFQQGITLRVYVGRVAVIQTSRETW